MNETVTDSYNNRWLKTLSLTFSDNTSFHEDNTQDDKQQTHLWIGWTTTHTNNNKYGLKVRTNTVYMYTDMNSGSY